LTTNLSVGTNNKKCWIILASGNPVHPDEFWVKQYPGRQPNYAFAFEGAFYFIDEGQSSGNMPKI
jgi:hypothetical protein